MGSQIELPTRVEEYKSKLMKCLDNYHDAQTEEARRYYWRQVRQYSMLTNLEQALAQRMLAARMAAGI